MSVPPARGSFLFVPFGALAFLASLRAAGFCLRRVGIRRPRILPVMLVGIASTWSLSEMSSGNFVCLVLPPFISVVHHSCAFAELQLMFAWHAPCLIGDHVYVSKPSLSADSS